MGKLFNYGTGGSSKNGGWSERRGFEEQEINGFGTNVEPSDNPRVAVPSPFARFQIIQEAFGVLSGVITGRKADKRDKRLVSQVLDVFQLIYEGGLSRYNLEVETIDFARINEDLQRIGEERGKDGMRLLGETLKSYASRETFGINETKPLYVIHLLGEPLAITSPTSGFLPSPDYDKWGEIKLNGDRPIFTKVSDLIDRDPEFILYVYSWWKQLVQTNGDIPTPISNFGKYLMSQREMAPKDLKKSIIEIPEISRDSKFRPIDFKSSSIRIWGTPIYTLAKDSMGGMVAEQSDLRIAPTVADAPHPLVLTTNNHFSDLVYTSGSAKWDSSNPGFSYADRELQNTPIHLRRILPNGVEYNDGFIYEHDFLGDTLIHLPYRLNSEIFFTGNIEGLEDECDFGLLPPIKEAYFDFFTIEDLKESFRMVVHTAYNDPNTVDKVEVFLRIPTANGYDIVLKKEYYPAESLKSAMTDSASESQKAVGCIAPYCGVAVNALPFNRAFTKNYYAFQLLFDPMGMDGYRAKLGLGVFGKGKELSHEVTENFYQYVRRSEDGIPTVTSYVLDGGNFDYLKIKFSYNKEKETVCETLLIPSKEIPEYICNDDRVLEFSIDFGTSNTFVAVKDEKGFIDFKLPSEFKNLMVSTISESSRDSDDMSVMSFNRYCRQEFIPKFEGLRSPFPVSTVISRPKSGDKDANINEEQLSSPFLSSSIPFVYGSEDYGSSSNKIISNLKWRKKGGDDVDYTSAFIQEIVLLTQVFAMSEGADLQKCKLHWTYPLSMPSTDINGLQRYFKKAFEKFFKGQYDEDDDDYETENIKNKSVYSFPESLAPMLYLYSKASSTLNDKSEETVMSVDIGGGTCDIVIIPDGEVEDLKMTSIKFGANCIFGIDGDVKDITLLKNATKCIIDIIEKKAIKTNPNAEEYKNKAQELRELFDRDGTTASEMSTYLFGLPNNPILSEISRQVSFNTWIKSKVFYHSVFLYYYAAIIFYLADLWRSFEDIDLPSRIFFSGSGSKILDIISRGDKSMLNELTTDLFKSFVKEDLDRDQLEELILVTRESKEPKQITAKGVVASFSSKKLKKIKDELSSKSEEKSKKSIRYVLKHSMFEDDDLSYEKLIEDETMDKLISKLDDFHTRFNSFLQAHSEDYEEIIKDIEEKFLNTGVSERRMRKKMKKILQSEDIDSMDNGGYEGVPFLEVVKNNIIKAMVNSSL